MISSIRDRLRQTILVTLALLLGVANVIVGVPLSGMQVSAAGSAPRVQKVVINTSSILTLNGDFYGFGAQDNNEYLWTPALRKLGARGAVIQGEGGTRSDFDGVITPRLIAMHLGIARTFVDLRWLFPNPPNCAERAASPVSCDQSQHYQPSMRNSADEPIFTPNSVGMSALYADLEVLRRAGTRSLVTVAFVPGWMNQVSAMREKVPQGIEEGPVKLSEVAAPIADVKHVAIYAADMARFVQVLHQHGFNNVIGLSAPNELVRGQLSITRLGDVRGCSDRLTSKAPDLPTLAKIYFLLASDLKAEGVRVQLFAPELRTCDMKIVASSPSLVKLLGFLSYHEYQSLACMFPNLDEARAIAVATRRQVWITEMGVGPRVVGCRGATTTTNVDEWQGISQKAIVSVDAGIAGVSLWSAGEVAEIGSASRQAGDGLWGEPSLERGKGYELRRSYYAWTDITTQTQGERSVYPNSCASRNGAGLCGPFLVAALGDPNGRLTIIVFNRDPSARRISFSFMRSSQRLRRVLFARFRVSGQGSTKSLGSSHNVDQPAQDGSVLFDLRKGTLTDTLAGDSLTVYSN